MNTGRHGALVSRVFPQSSPSTLADDAWQLDPERSPVAFAVPFWWGLGTVKGHAPWG
jgi:hypothetical protein